MMYGTLQRPTVDPLTVARAEAIFTSDLSASDQPTLTDANGAINRARGIHGGTRGCAMSVAAEFGDHPETAAPRMRWALAVVRKLYPVPATGGSRAAPACAGRGCG